MQDDTSDKNKNSSGLSKEVAKMLMADFAKKHRLPPAEEEEDEIVSLEEPHTPSSASDDYGDETLPYEFSVEKNIPLTKDEREKLRRGISLSVTHLMSDEDKEDLKKYIPPQRSHFEVGAMMRDEDEDDHKQFVVDKEALRREYLDGKKKGHREFVYDDVGDLDEMAEIEMRFPNASSPSDLAQEPLIKQRSEASMNESFYAQASTEKKKETVHKPLFQPGDDVLKIICDAKRAHVDRQKSILLESRLREKVHSMPEARGFLSSINKTIAAGKNALIAEIKKASPSKGVIRTDFEPGLLGRAYEEGGATCISVLTDKPYFQGRDEYISAVKHMCRLPVLRKDFILEPYQVVESRALGADCILLIMAALDINTAIELEKEAMALGMDVLVEVHDEKELEQALHLKTMLIGINNRNLKTLKVDLEVTEKLAPRVPSPRTVVCESGIYSFGDIQRMNNAHVKAFLVGESLMSQEDVKRATQWLLGGN